MLSQPNRNAAGWVAKRLRSSAARTPSIGTHTRIHHHPQSFHTTPFLRDDDPPTAPPPAVVSNVDRKLAQQISQDYNNRRAAYNRQVSGLRRDYAAHIAADRAAQAAAAQAERERLTRQRLERQRRKNERSAANALRQEHLRVQQAQAFAAHVEQQQVIRTAKEERLRKARQLVIDELEKEAPLWLTNKIQVEDAFHNPAVTQQLWGRPGGVLGAPNPSMDAHFWCYETHTPDMALTYPSRRQVLLEKVLEQVYEESNIDTTGFWTPERTAVQERRERRARLRAMVQTAGKKALLERQRELIASVKVDEVTAAVGKMKVPSRKVWGDKIALEKEGSQVLLEKPQEFFHFESAQAAAPIGLKDALRDMNGGYVFPTVIGKYDSKQHEKTAKEKKQAQRQERFMAAANKTQDQKKQNEEREPEILDDDFDDEFPDADYEAAERDSDDEEWEKGLNPVTDEALLKLPKDKRYTKDEIEWVIDQMENKLDHHEQQLNQDISSMQVDFVSGRSASAALREEEQGTENTIEMALGKLPEDQVMKLSDLDDVYSPDMSATDLEEAIQGIPGLSREQILVIVNRDRSLLEAED